MARVLSVLSSILLAWSLTCFAIAALVTERMAFANPYVMTCSGNYQGDCPNYTTPASCGVCCAGGVCTCEEKTVSGMTGCVCGPWSEECDGYDDDTN